MVISVLLLNAAASGCGGTFSLSVGEVVTTGEGECIQQDIIQTDCFFEEVLGEECFEQQTLVEVCEFDFLGIEFCTEELIIEVICEPVVIDVIEVCEDVVIDTVLICD